MSPLWENKLDMLWQLELWKEREIERNNEIRFLTAFVMEWKGVSTRIDTCCWRWQDMEKHDLPRKPARHIMVMMLMIYFMKLVHPQCHIVIKNDGLNTEWAHKPLYCQGPLLTCVLQECNINFHIRRSQKFITFSASWFTIILVHIPNMSTGL